MHLRMADQTHEPDRTGWQPADAGAFDDVVEQLEAYFDGSLIEFDVEFHLEGTEFQRRVWDALRTIPYGETRCYGEIAAQIGSPGAAGRWARPTAVIRSASSCPATAWWDPPAV